MLVTDVVMALVVCRPDHLRLNVSRLNVSRLAMCMARCTVSRVMRSTTGTNHALGYCTEREKTPQGEPKQEGLPAEGPPLIPHPATLRR